MLKVLIDPKLASTRLIRRERRSPLETDEAVDPDRVGILRTILR